MAASTESARIGAYYAGPGNAFWPTLYQIGLIPVALKPTQFRQVLQYGIGLTDMAKRASGRDSALDAQDLDAIAVRKKIITYVPRLLAFNGKRAASVFLNTARVQYGLQSVTIESTGIFVLPSTSGAARGYWDVSYWQALAQMIKAYPSS